MASMKRCRKSRASVACVACRQMKLKCDRPDALEDPCSRCGKLNISCYTDANFKRKKVKSDTEELDYLREEVKRLKSTLSSITQDGRKTDKATAIGPEEHSLRQAIVPSEITTTSAGPNTLKYSCECERSLGDLTLSRTQITEFHGVFWDKYHPKFPTVSLQDPDTLYERSVFLFWSICALGSRSCDVEVAKSLDEKVRTLAIQAPFDSRDCVPALSAVQALSLIAFWQTSIPNILDLKCWLYCGVAMQMSLYLGLHHPDHFYEEYGLHEDRSRVPREEVVQTRLGCYVVNQIWTSIQGLPPTTRDNPYVDHLLRSFEPDINVDATLKQLCATANHLERSAVLCYKGLDERIWDQGHHETIYSGLLKHWEGLQRATPPRSITDEILRLWTLLKSTTDMLHASTPYALQQSAVDTAFKASVDIINLAVELESVEAASRRPGTINYVVLMAASLLFKVNISCFHSRIDKAISERSLNSAHTFYLLGETGIGNGCARFALMVETMIRVLDQGLLTPSGAVLNRFKTRMGGNVLYEAATEIKDFHRFESQKGSSSENAAETNQAFSADMDFLRFLDNCDNPGQLWDLLM